MTYVNKIAQIKSEFDHIRVKEDLKDIQLIKYYQVEYFLRNFYEKKPPHDALEFFKAAQLNQALSLYDLNHYRELKNNFSIIGLNKLASPAIYCAFHFGSYRAIGGALHEAGIDFSVVASASVLQKSGQMLENLHHQEASHFNTNCSFEIINVNLNSAIVKMIRSIREGRSLIIYIDGSNGLGEFNLNEGNLLNINFLDRQIFSRKGIAFLSHRLKVPIIPVVSWRENDFEKVFIQFFDQIIPNGKEEDYVAAATQSIWDTFSHLLIKDPRQWEAVFYSSAFLAEKRTSIPPLSLGEADLYAFNTSQFDLFTKDGEGCYLYHFENAKVVKIPAPLYKLLLHLKNEGEAYTFSEYKELISESTLKDLIDNKILSY